MSGFVGYLRLSEQTTRTRLWRCICLVFVTTHHPQEFFNMAIDLTKPLAWKKATHEEQAMRSEERRVGKECCG